MSWSVGAAVAVGAGSALRVFFRLPCCPASSKGVSRVLVSDFYQVAAAIETEPGASPNCASIAE